MNYIETTPIKKEKAEETLKSGDAREIVRTLVQLTFYEQDRIWVESKLRAFSTHPDVNVRRSVATCIGHLARIYCEINEELLFPTLKALWANPETKLSVEDALDDVSFFLKKDKREIIDCP